SRHAIDTEARLYDTLFTKRNPDDVPEGENFTVNLNPKSLEVISSCRAEPSLKNAVQGSHYQFERLGYFFVDSLDANKKPIFNRVVTLRDTWAKIERKL
ncbi:MAG: glutamine--tRNA ligase, partial [Candidatus Omnitrophica bacterium]|nr:glutamine--tRNA ligase [Candidatus Omnitrophota bacterium]